MSAVFNQQITLNASKQTVPSFSSSPVVWTQMRVATLKLNLTGDESWRISLSPDQLFTYVSSPQGVPAGNDVMYRDLSAFSHNGHF